MIPLKPTSAPDPASFYPPLPHRYPDYSPSHRAAALLQSMHHPGYYPPNPCGFHMLIAAAHSEGMEEPKRRSNVEGRSPVSSPVDGPERGEERTAGPLKKRRTAGREKGFFELFHGLLGEEGSARAVEWMDHGRGFRVLRWDVLCEEVLPRCFQGRRGMDCDGWIRMFCGYLDGCGFERVGFGRDYGSFRHQYFLRDQPELLKHLGVPRHTNTRSSPTRDTEIGRSGSSLDGGMEWHNARRVASIFKLPKTDQDSLDKAPPPRESPSHPPHLQVPILSSNTTASFAETWCDTEGTNEDHPSRHPTRRYDPILHFSRPRAPHTRESEGRSPKIIRFQEDIDRGLANRTVSAVEISPNETSSPIKVEGRPVEKGGMGRVIPLQHHCFPVSRRGGRGGGRGGMHPVSARHSPV